MMNIGFRPTVNGKVRTIEVHYFKFNENLYDKKIKIEFLDLAEVLNQSKKKMDCSNDSNRILFREVEIILLKYLPFG
mgnify:CR=1 FL=1